MKPLPKFQATRDVTMYFWLGHTKKENWGMERKCDRPSGVCSISTSYQVQYKLQKRLKSSS